MVFDENYHINAVKSSVFLMIQRFTVKFFSFFKTVILARLLFPDDFGLFGLATLMIASVEALTQTGYMQSLIQKNEVSDEELNTVWTFQLLWYSILGLLTMVFIAPLSQYLFNNGRLPILVVCLSLGLVIRSFDNIGISLWIKKMRYDKQFWYDVLPVLVEIFTAIGMAFIFRNFWALIISVLVGRLASTICSYIFHPFRPKVNFSWKLLAPFLKFGKWLGLASIISFIATRFDQATLGANLNTADLGHYVVALSLGTLPATELSKAFITVLFPLYSKFANNKDTLLSIYQKVTKVIASISIPASLGLFVLAANAVLVIYGQKWLPITLIVKMFCILGLIKSFDYLVNPLTLGSGKSKIAALNSSIIAFISLLFSIPAVKAYGLVGAASVIIFGQILAVVVNNIVLAGKMKWQVMEIYRPMLMPLMAGGLMAGGLNWFKDLLANDIIGLLVKILFGVVCYIIFLLIIDKFLDKNSLRNSWRWLVNNIFNKTSDFKI